MNQLYHVDAFTDVPFKGNPAAVCILQQIPPDEWMRELAADMNLSETAFVYNEASKYRLRWFTPQKEVTLCGHATLASAHVLWEEKLADSAKDITFLTLSGALYASKKGKMITLDFPARTIAPAETNYALNQALGAAPVFTGKYVTEKGTIYLLEYQTESTVRALEPDSKAVMETDARAVIVTARSATSGYDFISRYFAPAVGIDEDPVTGSSHCCLAPYWTAKLGRSELTGYQASHRGGYVTCKHLGERVQIGGSAVTICKGQLLA